MAQTTCDPDKFIGPNLVVNGSFEDGDQDFTTEIAHSWNAAGANQWKSAVGGNTWSSYNEYYIGASPSETNPGGNRFQSSWSQSPSDGNKFMMIDGACSAVVWKQTIVVEDTSNYFFSVDVSTLNPSGQPPVSVANMRFKINGDTLGTIIAPNVSEDGWETFTQVWYSGNVSGSIDIEIIDEQSSCTGNDEDDFGLDNIIFKLGCDVTTLGPVPDLGDDQTLCGTNGTITLDPGVPVSPDVSIYWSTGVNDGDYTIDITTPGTYGVCVDSAGSCMRADKIVISDDYEVSLEDPVELCSPASDTLDAGHSGNGVTYEWTYDDGAGGDPVVIGNQQKQFINQIGEYKVKVTDPTSTCGIVEDSSAVTIKAGAPEPTNVYFCNTGSDTTVSLSVSGTGPFDWYVNDSTTTALLSNSSTFPLNNIDTTSDIYYVGTTATTTFSDLGPTSTASSVPIWDDDSPNWYREFDALADLTINSVEMSADDHNGTCGADGTISGDFIIELYKDGVFVPGATYTTTLTCRNNGNNFDIVPINFSVPKGTGYELRVSPFGSQVLFSNQNAGDKAEQTEADVITFKEATDNFAGVFFNWNIDASSPCDRAPVQAIWTCALPIVLLDFNGRYTENGHVIEWVTASEENNDYFEVFRSYDGINFESIRLVAGQGTTFEKSNYTIIDAIDESAYYKIVSTDFDGTSYESGVVFIESKSLEISIEPNPSKDSFVLNFTHSERKTISIYSLNGALIEEIETYDKSIEIGFEYEAGVYLFKISDHNKAITKKAFKED